VEEGLATRLTAAEPEMLTVEEQTTKVPELSVTLTLLVFRPEELNFPTADACVELMGAKAVTTEPSVPSVKLENV
jgi:hypothetical protein